MEELTHFILHPHDKGRAVGVKDEAVCVFIKTDYHIFILSGIPFIYDAGKYIADVSGALTKTIIKNYIEFELIKSTTINRIYNLLIADYELQACEDMLNRYPDNWIPFDDCLYSVLDGVENEYKPEYRVINKIPYKYADVKQASNGEELEKLSCENMENNITRYVSRKSRQKVGSIWKNLKNTLLLQ